MPGVEGQIGPTVPAGACYTVYSTVRTTKVTTFAVWALLLASTASLHAQTFSPAEALKKGRSALIPFKLASLAPGLSVKHLNRLFDAARYRLPDFTPPRGLMRKAMEEEKSLKNKDKRPLRPTLRKALRRNFAVPAPAPRSYEKRAFRSLEASPEKIDRYDETILKYSSRYGLDARLVKAVMAAESGFYRKALSPKGARGLMQVMPRTGEMMGVPRSRLFDPEANIRAGTAYIARLFRVVFKRYKLEGLSYRKAPQWIITRVIAAYNAGPRFLFRDKRFRETRKYVRKVLMYYNSRVTDMRRAPTSSPKFPMVALKPQAGSLY